jgi:hypothetical protein
MLNAYASPAREEHKVPMSRFWALIAVTDRFELLDTLLREIGAALLVGEEIHTARLGHIDRQIARLQAERKRIAGVAPIIGERGLHERAERIITTGNCSRRSAGGRCARLVFADGTGGPRAAGPARRQAQPDASRPR